MKKILLFVLFFVVTGMAANAYIDPDVDMGYTPKDVTVYELYDDDILDATDSIATDEYNIIVPYPITKTTNGFQHKAVGIKAAALAAGDSLAVSYQLIRGKQLSDTVTGKWLELDTIALTGAQNLYVDISDEFGEGIVFKILNYTAGEVVVNQIKAFLRKNVVFREQL